jgi:hypothetical protein
MNINNLLKWQKLIPPRAESLLLAKTIVKQKNGGLVLVERREKSGSITQKEDENVRY